VYSPNAEVVQTKAGEYVAVDEISLERFSTAGV
jgi:hypothetical protein